MASKAQRAPLGLRAFTIGFLVLWMLLAAFPFVWTLWGSFKVEGDFFSKANWANAIFGTLTHTISVFSAARQNSSCTQAP